MSDPAGDDQDFIRKLQQQDNAAFVLLVKKHHHKLVGFAGSIAGERHAEEIVQEAWVAAWRALPEFEGRSLLKTWLYTIVRNECTARLRKEARLVMVNMQDDTGQDGVDDWLDMSFVANGHWSESPASWAMNTPETMLEEEHMRDCIERNINRLQGTQQAVFRMRDLEQLSLEEICNIVQLSSSNVRVLLHRARLKLMQVIEHYQKTGEC